MFEDLRREVMEKNAQQHSFVVQLKVEEDFRKVRRRKAAENFAQLREIALLNQFLQFRPEQVADHPANQTQLLCERKAKSRPASQVLRKPSETSKNHGAGAATSVLCRFCAFSSA